MHLKARVTIEVLNRNLVMGEAPLERIFKFYQETNRQNVIKLLLRVVKMY